jgi:hypothetical protein
VESVLKLLHNTLSRSDAINNVRARKESWNPPPKKKETESKDRNHHCIHLYCFYDMKIPKLTTKPAKYSNNLLLTKIPIHEVPYNSLLPVFYLRIRSTAICAAMLLFSPRLSTFSCILALRLTTDGSAPSSSHKLDRITSLKGLIFGSCKISVASRLPSS